MYFIDTHTHLYDEQFNTDRTTVIDKAIQVGVSKMLIPNVDVSTITPMLEIVQQFPNNVFPMLGLHPCYVKPNTYQQELDIIYEQLKNTQVVAIGEIGLDLYWDKSTLEIQKKAFEIQCNWAIERDLPIAIHSRESTHELIAFLKEQKQLPKGVFHCFTGSYEEAQEIIKLGFYLGIGGVLTYKNTNLRTTLAKIDINHIVLETDSPYLPPVPHRGKRNESSYIPIIANVLAEIYQKEVESIAEITSRNAVSLFGTKIVV